MILHHHRLPWYKSEHPIFQLTYPFNTLRTSASQMNLERMSHMVGNSEKEKWIRVCKSQTVKPIPWVVMAKFGLWNSKWPGSSRLQFVVPSQLLCHFVVYISHQRGFNCCALALLDIFSLSPTVIFQWFSNIFSTCTMLAEENLSLCGS